MRKLTAVLMFTVMLSLHSAPTPARTCYTTPDGRGGWITECPTYCRYTIKGELVCD